MNYLKFNPETMNFESPRDRERTRAHRPQEEGEPSPTVAPIEAMSTVEIKSWLSQMELLLNNICSISNEAGKLNSEQKLKIGAISRNVMGGMSQMAVEYQSLKQKYISAQIQIKNMHERKGITGHLEDQLEDLKQFIRSSQKETSQSTSFADIVRIGNNSLARPLNTSSVVVYPQDKEKTSEETKKLIQTVIKPDELKLRIRGMRKTKDGGIIISAQGKEDLEKLKQSEQLKTSGLKVEETRKRKPKIILLGVPANSTDKEVFECLFEQNISDKHPQISRDQFLSSIKLSHKSGKKDAQYCNFILELTPGLRKILIAQERLFINWTSCPVRDFTLVTRCYKCQLYGHSAKYCRESDPTCGHCGCVGHTIKECSKRLEPAACASCKRFNKPSQHKTGDEHCPARKSAEIRFHSFIDYGSVEGTA